MSLTTGFNEPSGGITADHYWTARQLPVSWNVYSPFCLEYYNSSQQQREQSLLTNGWTFRGWEGEETVPFTSNVAVCWPRLLSAIMGS